MERVIVTFLTLLGSCFSVDLPEVANGTHNISSNIDGGAERFAPASSMVVARPSSTLAAGSCRLDTCPAKYLNGCCHKELRRRLDAWFSEGGVPESVKQTVRHGTYGQLDPTGVALLPLIVVQRLNDEGAQFFSTSQMRTLLAKYPNEVIGNANILGRMRLDYFDVFLMNLKIDLERHVFPFSNVTSLVHQAIVWAARRQWGPFSTWKESQLKVLSHWTPQLPCYAYYLLEEHPLMDTVLPEAIAQQKSLDDCSKKSLFSRIARISQLINLNSWDVEKTVSFAPLLSAAPAQVLSTLSQFTVQVPRVLESLAQLNLGRDQVEAVLSTLRNTLITSEMLVAMGPTDSHGSGATLLKYLPPWLLDSHIPANVFAEPNVAKAVKTTFCKVDMSRSFKTGYQIYWMYRRPSSAKDWFRKDIEELGCLSRYLAPLDMAQFDLLEMAKDIESSFTKTFEHGDYSFIQAKILFNYGRQLLHLGSASWVADRFLAIPAEIVPGIPIQKISEFPWEEISKEAVVKHFCLASHTKLGLNKAQVAVLMRKLNSVPNGGLTSVVRSTSLSSCLNLIKYVPFIKMQQWNTNEMFFEKAPQFTISQANYWLRRSLTSNSEYSTVRTLTKFLHGLDCDLVSKVDMFETPALLSAIQEGGIVISPETARCLKDLLLDYLQSFDDQPRVGNSSAKSSIALGAKNYWPALVGLAGTAINLQMSSAEVRHFSPDTCKAAIASATDFKGARQLQRMLRPRGRRESFIRAAINCVESQPKELFQLGMSESVVLKYALSEMPSDYYSKIPDEIIYKSVNYMQGGCLSNGQRRGLRAKLLSTFGQPESWQQEDVGRLHCLLYELEPAEFARISDAALMNYIQSLGRCWDDRDQETRHFRVQCEKELGNWEALQQRDRIRRVSARLSLLAKHNVLVTIYNAPRQYGKTNSFLPEQPAISHWNTKGGSIGDTSFGSWPDYSSLRMLNEPTVKKDIPIRDPWAGDSLNITCDWLKAAGPHIVHMPFESFFHPSNMSSLEFIRCIPTFAEFDWHEMTRDALWDRIKTEIGFPSPPELESMGYLLLSLKEEELKQLDFSQSLDLVHAFGSLEDWSEAQLQILAHRFRMTVTPIVENLDAVQLVAMGSILCGFSQNEIEKLNVEVYIESSVAIGGIRRCSVTTLRGLAKLATRSEAFGEPASWTSATLSTIGIVAAGLSAPDLIKIPPRSLNGITCYAVAMMSPHQFQAFTLEQLEFFSMDGAMCVDGEHIQLLNEVQRFALWEAGSDAFRMNTATATFNCNPLLFLFTLVYLIVWVIR